MNVIRTLLLLLVIVAITLALLLAGATGVGVLLHWLMPAIGLGTAVLIGAVTLTVSLRFVLGLWGQAQSLGDELSERDDIEELEEIVSRLHRPARRRQRRT